jgi:DNA-nicking Smr family endonuclease
MTDETDDFDEEPPVEIPIEEELDLHPFAPREVRDVVLDYLTEARARGFREVRLIHGRGTGTLRRTIHALLDGLDWVRGYHDADGARANWGATVVHLRGIED